MDWCKQLNMNRFTTRINNVARFTNENKSIILFRYTKHNQFHRICTKDIPFYIETNIFFIFTIFSIYLKKTICPTLNVTYLCVMVRMCASFTFLLIRYDFHV